MLLVRPVDITDAMYTASNLTENDYAAHSMATIYSKGDRCISTATHKVYESLRGAKATVTITVASPGVISWPSHGLSANKKVRFSTTGALPTGLAANTDYYVSATGLTADSFSVSTTAGGASVNTTVAGSGVQTCFEVVNVGYDPTVAANTATTSGDVTGDTMWIEVGATAKWRYFDESISAQASAANQLTLTIKPGAPVDVLALFNLDAESVTVTQKDGATVLYDKTFNLSLDNVFDWADYFFEPIVRDDKLVLDDLLPYGTADVTITINAPNGTAKCGEIVIGQSRNIGTLLWEPTVKIIDYSRKTTDDFGNTKVVKRSFADLLRCQLKVDNSEVDEVKRILSEFRSTPAVWVGDGDFDSLTVYGFYRDFELVIASPAGSDCNLEIEGLT